MSSFRLIALSALFATSFAIPVASALTVDENGHTAASTTNLVDPDDRIPFPHIGDDGQAANFQSSQDQDGGLSFSLTGGNNNDNQGSAFERAQQRMQQ